MNATIHRIDFARGALVPLSPTDLLPVGSLVTYGDRCNQRKPTVIVGADCGTYGHGQRAVCEDGHASSVHASDIRETHGGWQFVRDDAGEPVVLDAGQIRDFLAKAEIEKARLHAESEAAASAKAKADAETKAAIIAEFPYMEREGVSKRSGCALASANIKKLLAREFPGCEFSVKSSRYSGGSSVDVSWSDGPTNDEVDKFADRFQDGDFDGMDDSYSYRKGVWPDVFGGAKYVHCHRTVGNGNLQAVADELGIKVSFGAYHELLADNYDDQRRVLNEAGKRSYYVRPAATEPQSVTLGTVEGVTVTENEELDGVELRFPAKPAPEVLSTLKAHGWRWNGRAGCWYIKRTPDSLAFARTLAAT